MITPALKALALEQCLPILITKHSNPDVHVGSMSVEAARLSSDKELHEFHQEFVQRRLLAEAPDLLRILQEISQRPSWHNRIERSRDHHLRGRLDVAQYIRQRASLPERPRSFPIITQQRQLDTPENRFAAGVLGSIRLILANEVFPARSAESTLSRSYYRSLTKLAREHVFTDLRRPTFNRRDLALTRFRVDRRMTGNDRPYRQLLEWVDNWLLSTGLTSPEETDRSVELALPDSESYWEKIFEVWCLEQTRASLVRLGWHTDSLFRLHSSRRGKPIAIFTKGQLTVELYFQSQTPLGTGRWRSTQTKSPLMGIPDVALARPGRAALLIDAKWRFRALSHSTSEEQYKMLGYAENFAHNSSSGEFFGVLVFVSDMVASQTFSRGDSGRLTTLRSDLLSPDFGSKFDEELAAWLEH